MENILELRHVNKIYGTTIKTQVLTDINVSFKKGSFSSIIGQSGSGKSTMLNIMGTLDTPTSGEVLINGVDTAKLSKGKLADIRNKNIGFVFQFHYLLPEFTALENVLMPYRIGNSSVSPEVRQRAEELMKLVGLEKVKNNNATQMSGGQQQRTAIARALLKKIQEHGQDGLEDRRGHRPPPHEPQTEEERLRQENEQLKKANYRLQMEIDFIKKLKEVERRNR